ncbi:MAG TPA: hypothetical protein VKA69_12005, partial [Desulfobacteria bacterium]|nr:hypothetical protein [Desulfobacteria bacterium]
MTVLASHDLKESLSDNQIVTAEELRACLRYPSQTIETAYGPVEYAVRGEGPVALIAHGGP